jgi:outer membrane biosynthesis protein TonB
MPKPALPRLVAPLAALAAALTVAACAAPRAEPTTRNAQVLAPPADPCVLAREDAAANPRLEVEKVPTPVRMQPPPIRTPVPRSALRRDGSSTLRVEVLVDTLGKPDMSTFHVIESTSAWLTTGARTAIAQWTFEPAQRNGCKVARYYQFTANSPPRRR